MLPSEELKQARRLEAEQLSLLDLKPDHAHAPQLGVGEENACTHYPDLPISIITPGKASIFQPQKIPVTVLAQAADQALGCRCHVSASNNSFYRAFCG